MVKAGYFATPADLRGGGGEAADATLFPSGIWPPADPKGPLLYYFEIIFVDGP